MAPLVSVILTTFNRAAYLRESIDSILSQSLDDFELIVIDDGSTDGTAELVKSQWSDLRIVYYYQQNQGFSAARNRALALARGEYLAFLDSDDKYFPHTLASHLEIGSKSLAGLTVGGYDYIDEEGRYLGERRPWLEGTGLDLSGWLFNCYTVPSAALLHRSWYERVGGFDDTTTAASDWDLFLRLALAGCAMTWVPKSVCQYRLHASNMSRNIPVHRAGALEAVRKVFQSPKLPTSLLHYEGKVQAWVHVVYAKKAIFAGLQPLTIEDLGQAIRLDPELKGRRKIDLLEFLLSDEQIDLARPVFNYPLFLEYLPRQLGISYWHWQSALARLAMSKFFKTMNLGNGDEALTHLVAGLKRNPFWLANRGVLAFVAKYIRNRVLKRIGRNASAF